MSELCSVVIPTYGPAPYLAETLASLRQLEFPASDFRVYVISNGNDSPPQCVREWQHSYSQLEVIEQREANSNLARNLGISSSRGEYIVFFDDDVVVSSDYLTKLVEFFASNQVAGVSGRILPHFRARRPKWLSDELLPFLSIKEDPRRYPMLFPETPIGANMAFKRSALVAVGGFDPAFDKSGRRFLSSGEVELAIRMQNLGLQIMYEPALVIRHILRPERLTRRYLLRRCIAEGKTEALLVQKHPGIISTEDRRTYRRMFINNLQTLLSPHRSSHQYFTAACQVALHISFVLEELRLSTSIAEYLSNRDMR